MSQTIAETRVAAVDWHVKHWKTLQATYGKSARFEDVGPLFKNLYRSADSPYLSEINLVFLKAIAEILGIRAIFKRSQDIPTSGDRNERLVQICQQVGADVYLSGPAARSYLDVEQFSQAEIDVEWMEYPEYPEYFTCSKKLWPSASVIDLLFKLGTDAAKYLERSRLARGGDSRQGQS